MKKLGSLVMDLTANTSKFKTGLNEATRSTKKFTQSQKSITKTLAANWKLIGTAIAAIATSRVIGGLKEVANNLDRIAKQSLSIGISPSEFQLLGEAAAFFGNNMEQLSVAFSTFNKNIGQGLPTVTRALQKMGLSLNDLRGQSFLNQFQIVSTGLRNLKSTTEQSAVASALFSGQFKEILPFLVDGGSQVERLKAKWKELNLEISDSDFAAVQQFNDSITGIEQTVERIKQKIVIGISDELLKVGDRILKDKETVDGFVTSIKFLISASEKLVIGLSKGINIAGSSLGIGFNIFMSMVNGVRVVIGTLQDLYNALGATLTNLIQKLIDVANKVNPFSDIPNVPEYIPVKFVDTKQATKDLENNLDRVLKNFEKGFGEIFGEEFSFSGLGNAITDNMESISSFSDVLKTLNVPLTLSRVSDYFSGLRNRIQQSIAPQQTVAASTDVVVEPDTKGLFDTSELRLKLSQVNKERQKSIDIIREQIGLLSDLAKKETVNSDAWLELQIKIGEKYNDLEEVMKPLEVELNKLQQAAVSFGDELTQAFVNAAADGKFAFGDLANYVLAQIIKMAVQSAIIAPLFGSGQNGETLGLITSAFSGIKGYADGGRPPVGVPSVVGESGPELFVPAVSGRIIPNSELGGGPTINIDARGADVAAVQRLERAFANLNATVEMRALTSVQDVYGRTPNYLRR